MPEKMGPNSRADAANRHDELRGQPGKFKAAGLTPDAAARFRQQIYRYFQQHGRHLPWRTSRDPYQILVSEIMLQQTQVERVTLKYEPFLAAFPDVASLARAPLAEVMAAWQGLGYNRRALALKRIAQRLMAEFGGRLPEAVDTLRTLPGIGPATAGALAAFAFNQPVGFIETNIRRVFIHCFFAGQHGIRDREILPLVEKTLDRERPRTWYYALMDYGAALRRPGANANRRSAHYQRQSPFTGSDRQIRGLILKTLLEAPAFSFTAAALVQTIGQTPARTQSIIDTLIREGFLEQVDNHLGIAAGPDDLR
jgi:A/G-specific adenine glycosylase